MPRARTISDHDLLDSALIIVRRDGPDALTFAALAASTGLAASTLVQRFGTKAGLLHEALSLAWDRLEASTAALAAETPATPQGVIDLLVGLSQAYGSADDLADGLLLLREDLRDPVLRQRGRVWFEALSGFIESRLAVTGRDCTGLGQALIAQWQGTVTWWSFTRAEPLPDVVRAALEDLMHRLGILPTGGV